MTARVFDTETTGFEKSEIIEAAYLDLSCVKDMKITGAFCSRYKPTVPIEYGAMATHHIIDEELSDCEPSSSFRLPEDTTFLIGHNIDFDWNMVGKPKVYRICTLALSRKYFPQVDSHKQSAMIYYMYQDDKAKARELIKEAHSAKADVENCVRLLEFLVRHIRQTAAVDTWADLWELSEEARVPEYMPFGKHKGDHISDVPASYKQWLRRQEDVDPYLLVAIDRYR